MNYSFHFDTFGVHYREKDFELSKFGAYKDLELKLVGQCFALSTSTRGDRQTSILPFSPVGKSVTSGET